PSGAARPNLARIHCVSQPGETIHCPADTSQGVTLASSSGQSGCILGRSWGYDDKSVWAAEGCSGDFIAGRTAEGRPLEEEGQAGAPKQASHRGPEYIPNRGFRLYEGEN